MYEKKDISIHAPLAGRDLFSPVGQSLYADFNPRAPRGARPRRSGIRRKLKNFNPRAPRGARPWYCPECRKIREFQSTRPSRGATVKAGFNRAGTVISIHAPLAGRDRGQVPMLSRRAISIHAPLAGRDTLPMLSARSTAYFNPRAPRGARPTAGGARQGGKEFQSTRPSRGAT